ncbi:MAG TPA: hypothetical protein VKY57_06700 [Chitinispirillaceae bacterium]|nr:hypothetical protein [Chitinispirillaceae bacterium]
MKIDPKIDNLRSLAEKIKKKTGTELLNEYEILLLASEEIARTYTYKEKKYTE